MKSAPTNLHASSIPPSLEPRFSLFQSLLLVFFLRVEAIIDLAR